MSPFDWVPTFFVGFLASLTASLVVRRVRPEPRVAVWQGVVGTLVPVAYPLVGLYLLQRRWVIAPGYGVLVLLFLFVSALLVTALSNRAEDLPEWLGPRLVGTAKTLAPLLGPPLVRTQAVGLVVGLLLFLGLDAALHKYVSLDCPQALTSGRLVLEGRVRQVSWQPYVLIRPHGTSGVHTCEGSPPDQDGRWFADCAFGGGGGASFLVTAVVLDRGPLSDQESPPPPAALERNALHRSRSCSLHRIQ